MTEVKAGVKIGVLGPLEVRDTHDIDISRPSLRRLLSILVLEAGSRVATDSLIDRFWSSNPPPTAKAAIQTHISSLRKLIGDEAIATEGYGYRLALPQQAMDSFQFFWNAERAREHQRRAEWVEAIRAADEALQLWRGRPFVELQDDDFARPEMARLEELRMELLELRAEAHINEGRHEEVLPELESLTIENPYRERLWKHLMMARYRSGRHADALRAYQILADHLAEIGVEPSNEMKDLEERILLHDRSLSRTPSNLPKFLDDFVGRERELREVAERLASDRLVTLTGAGGSGKTRLAIETGSQLKNRYPDGVWFVDLSPLSDGSEIPSVVFQAMGVKPESDDLLAALLTRLEESTSLLILDNCEHLGEMPATVASTLLKGTEGLTILATSRASLRSPAETIYEVPGLSTTGVESGRSDAVELFLARASKAAGSSGSLRELDAIEEICHRLDGMPLAIELAAARSRSLSPRVIAERLLDRLGVVAEGPTGAPERQKTLEATFEWSYQLLDNQSQSLLRRLAVFRGGFNTEMAETVATEVDPKIDQAASVLADLIEKSLVARANLEGEARYRLLETTAQFAWSRSSQAEKRAVAQAHADWAVGFARTWHQAYLDGHIDESLLRLGAEIDNLSSALDHELDAREVRSAAALQAVISAHYDEVGQVTRAFELLDRALQSGLDSPSDFFWRAKISSLLFSLSQTDRAMSEVLQAGTLATSAEPSAEGAWALLAAARLAALIVEEDPQQAIELAERALEMATEVKAEYLIIRAHRELGFALAWNGESRRGLDMAYRSLELAREFWPEGADSYTYASMFDVIYLDPGARRDDPIRIAREMEERFGDLTKMGVAAHWLPWVYAQAGEFDAAELVVEFMAETRQEGFWRVWQLITRATVDWMTGRLDAAADHVRTLTALDPNPRWYHDFYPLVAEVHADRVELEQVRKAACEYTAAEVHTSEQAKKLGVLNPLVRAEVDAYIATSDPEHRSAATNAVEQMHALLVDHPPPTKGSVAMEIPHTHLAFARAEASRITGSDPGLWRRAAEAADYAYYQVYAQWRLGEALESAGDDETARTTLHDALRRSRQMGTDLLTRRITGTLESAELDLP